MSFLPSGPLLVAVVFGLVLADAQNPFQGDPPAHRNKVCRCFPGDSCWPTAGQWNSFNDTLGGKLIATVPIASVCHASSFGPYDEQQCEALRASWLTSATHDQSSSSLMMPYFANMSCDPFSPPSAQCVIGTYVQYAVNATTAHDYKKSLAFAQKRNIRLVVRNTGHDYLGKSTGAGALAIWTHHNKDIQVLDYRSNHYTGKALKLGAGVQGGEAQAVAGAAGLVIVTGNCPSVGIPGGFTQGGGLSPISSTLGLSADNVLEWEVVTASGQHLVATPERNKDLYWALSGGGGGTYAVVLSATVVAHPSIGVAAANLTFTYGGDVSPDAFWDVVTTFILTLPSIVDTGASVVWALVGNIFLVQPITAPGLSIQRLQELLKPTFTKLNESGIPYSSFIGHFPSYLSSTSAMNPDPGVLESNMGSRLIPRLLVSTNKSASALVEAIRFIVEDGAIFSGVSFNVSRSNGVAPNAVNVDWRSAIFNAVFGLPYNRTSLSANVAAQRRITEVLVPKLAALTPNGTAYLNEADFRQPNWQKVFYGNNYEKLLTVKRKYDPEDILYAVTAVGSGDWGTQDDGRLCRV